MSQPDAKVAICHLKLSCGRPTAELPACNDGGTKVKTLAIVFHGLSIMRLEQ